MEEMRGGTDKGPKKGREKLSKRRPGSWPDDGLAGLPQEAV